MEGGSKHLRRNAALPFWNKIRNLVKAFLILIHVLHKVHAGVHSEELHTSSKDRYLYAVVAVFLVYFAVWSFIVISRYLSLNAYVFDLGINMERGWELYYGGLSPYEFLKVIAFSGIVYVVSPITITGNYIILLCFQTLILGAGVFPVYLISRKILSNRKLSFLISATYLLYFPLAGINWYGFHYQSLFIPLFLFGYYFYLSKRYKWSLFLFALSGMSRFPYMIFPWIFSVEIIAQSLFHKYWEKEEYNPSTLKYALILLIVATIFLVLGLLFSGNISGLNGNINNDTSLGYSFNIDNKIMTLLLLLAPLLFLPLLSIRWIIVMIPFYFLVVSSNYLGYSFPHIFELQYPSGAIPFIFLGFIESISRIEFKSNLKSIYKSKLTKFTTGKFKIVLTAFIVTLLFASVYQPYGPLNNSSSDNFSLHKALDVNMTTYNELIKMVGLIPSNSGNILYQDNLPELLPRVLGQQQNIYASTAILKNVTVENAITNHFPVKNGTGVSYTSIEYAIADVENIYYHTGINTMSSLLPVLYDSGQYQILSEGSGLVLLKRDYSGPVLNYIPYKETFKAAQFINGTSWLDGNASITGTNLTNTLIWHGPWTYIFPGNYTVNFDLSTSNNSNQYSMLIETTTNATQIVLNSTIIYGSNFLKDNTWQSISLNFTSQGFYSDIEFLGLSYDWQGSISMRNITVKQYSP